MTDPAALLVADAADGLVVAHPVHAIARRFPDIAACQITPRTLNPKRVARDMLYGLGKRSRHLPTGRALPSWTSAENWLLAHAPVSSSLPGWLRDTRVRAFWRRARSSRHDPR